MSQDWDEIRRLAADLQRAQLSGSLQKLSERNCIEIVSRLLKLNLLDVIYTADGKEYLTPQQLQREIKDELYVSGGRVSLVDLAQTLNVDFAHIEYQATLIAKSSRVTLVLGQLVDGHYVDSICEELNEKLQLEGTLSLSVVTKEYDLPAEFVEEEVLKRLGSIIEGYRDETDPKILVTPSYVMRTRAKVRGALSAVTVPTAIAALLQRHKIQEQMFFSLADELIKTKRLNGSITGGKRASKATFVPAVYARAQAKWVEDFLSQNGYIEYDALTRLGITEPRAFIKRRFPESDLTFLGTCCVGDQILSNLESSIEDVVSGDSWIDVSPLLPSVLSPEDGKQLLQKIIDSKPAPLSSKVAAARPAVQVFADTVLFTDPMLEKVEKSFDALIAAQAKADIESKKYERLLGQKVERFDMEEDGVDRKEERRKKATGGKGGGGTQGRETKTKSTKKKYKGGGKGGDWSDDEEGSSQTQTKKKGAAVSGAQKIEYMSREDLEEKLASISMLQDCPEELCEELAAVFHSKLNQKFKAQIMDLYQSSILASTHGKRKTIGELQEKCNSLMTMVKLFEKGVKSFETDSSEQKSLEKHLLKTSCTELVNAVFTFVRDEHGEGGGDADLSPEQRVKVLAKVPKDVGESLLSIHRALSGDSVSKFIDCFETDSARACDIFIRKSDKKKDRQIVFNHRQSLMEQMEKCEDPALTLHLGSLVIFIIQTNNILQASGKFVPQILSRVLPSMEEEQGEFLLSYQKRVQALFAASSKSEEKEEKKAELEAELSKLKEIVLKMKKAGGSKE